jgi:hypothetical protein
MPQMCDTVLYRAKSRDSTGTDWGLSVLSQRLPLYGGTWTGQRDRTKQDSHNGNP